MRVVAQRGARTAARAHALGRRDAVEVLLRHIWRAHPGARPPAAHRHRPCSSAPSQNCRPLHAHKCLQLAAGTITPESMGHVCRLFCSATLAQTHTLPEGAIHGRPGLSPVLGFPVGAQERSITRGLLPVSHH